MILKALDVDWKKIPSEVEPFISQKQTFITPGKEYTVCSLSLYNKVLFALVVDDLNTPVFLPAYIFKIVNTVVPGDWICNLGLGGGVEMVIGPEFIAKNIDTYDSMVDQEADQVEKLWFWGRKENK